MLGFGKKIMLDEVERLGLSTPYLHIPFYMNLSQSLTQHPVSIYQSQYDVHGIITINV